MQEKYDVNDVEDSFTKFDYLVSDLLDSEYNTFDANLRRFINHCENDEIMSIVCNQLKYDNTIFEKWWFENQLNTLPHAPGGRKLNPPIDDKEMDSLYYQLCLKINNKEIDVRIFCINFTSNTSASIPFFNKVIVYPLVRSMKYKLNKIKSKIIQQGDKQYIFVQNFYVYQNFGTNINGGVITEGDAAIGGDASIEKKSII